MLHLDARVHLHEVVGAVRCEQPFDRPRRPVTGRARRIDGDLADPRTQLVGHSRRRRLLDELLMTALDRAVALAEVDHVAERVREHLHLDMPRVLEVPLDVHRRVGEVRASLALRGLQRLRSLVRGIDGLHPLAASAGGGLDQERVPELLAERDDLLGRADRIGGARDDGDAGRLHRLPRPRLRPHQLDRRRRRPDPDEAGVLDRPGEHGVLGEEPVAGMHRAGARGLGGGQELLDRRGSSRPRLRRRGRRPRRRSRGWSAERSTSE